MAIKQRLNAHPQAEKWVHKKMLVITFSIIRQKNLWRMTLFVAMHFNSYIWRSIVSIK